jgi:hypothetical protein
VGGQRKRGGERGEAVRDRHRERVCADKRTKTGWSTDCRPVFLTHYCLCRWACLCKSRRKGLAVKLQPDCPAPPAQASVRCSLDHDDMVQSALALAAPSSACMVSYCVRSSVAHLGFSRQKFAYRRLCLKIQNLDKTY